MADSTKIAIELRADTARFQSDLQRATSAVRDVVQKIDHSFSGLNKALSFLGVGVSIGGVVASIRAIGEEAIKEERSINQLNAVLLATGKAAGFTAAGLAKLAKEVQQTSVFDDDAIREAQTTLLRFRSIQQEVFAQTIRQLPDVAAVLGTTLPQAAAVMGRALTDPERGLRGLRDAGIKLSEQQIDLAAAMVETGNKAGAQKLILAELQKSIGGAGEADTKGLYGATKALGRSWDDLLKSLGRKAISDNEQPIKAMATGFDVLAEAIDKSNLSLGRFLLNASGLGAFNTYFDAAKTGLEKLNKGRSASGKIGGLEAVEQGDADFKAKVARLEEAADAYYVRQKKAVQKAAQKGGGGERISEGQRYLEQLKRQLQGTQDLTVVEKLLADIRENPKLAPHAERLIAVAQEIDAANKFKVVLEEQKRLREDEAHTRERISQMTLQSLNAAAQESASLADQNQQIREETELLGKDVVSIRAIYQARLDNLIITKEQALAMRVNAAGMDAEASVMQDHIDLLKQRKALLSERSVAEDLMEITARASEFNDIFASSMADGLSSIVDGTKSVGDAFKDMERQIVASITRIAAQNIAESVFGAGTSSGGGGIFKDIGPYLANLLGGSFKGFAGGGSPPVGRPSLVGEKGPELFIPRQAGVIVPNDVLNQKRSARNVSITNIINVPGNTSRASADQIAAATGASVQRALARLT